MNLGGGTFVFTASNSVPANTIVSAGILQLNHSLAAEDAVLTVNAANGLAFNAGLGLVTLGGLSGNGNLALQDTASNAVSLAIAGNAAPTTYSGILSGGSLATVTVNGGMTIFTGSNTYTGATTVSGGTLQLGDGVAHNGAIAGNITDNATLVFADPNSYNYQGVAQRQRRAIKTGAGNALVPV